MEVLTSELTGNHKYFRSFQWAQLSGAFIVQKRMSTNSLSFWKCFKTLVFQNNIDVIFLTIQVLLTDTLLERDIWDTQCTYSSIPASPDPLSQMSFCLSNALTPFHIQVTTHLHSPATSLSFYSHMPGYWNLNKYNLLKLMTLTHFLHMVGVCSHMSVEVRGDPDAFFNCFPP